MTTRKGFKRLVRARMGKTGESYAAARRMLLGAPGAAGGGSPSGSQAATRGIHPDTSAVATVLGARGVVSPVNGRPLSEAIVLVAGGGLGAGYILWEFTWSDAPILTLGFRNRWQYPRDWLGKTADRLGAQLAVQETTGSRGARDRLDGLVDRGEAAIVYPDQQIMGTWHQPAELSGHGGYPVVVVGRTPDGGYLVDDRGAAPLHVAADVMSSARARIGSFKHRLVESGAPAGAIPIDRLREALLAGLNDQVDHLRSPSDSFSLPAWRKWSRLLTDTRNAKAWPRVFADGRGLFRVLLSVIEEVDGGIGAAGGHLRELYAEGLDEAADVLDRPGLLDAAAAWRASGDLWEDLADAAAPDELDGAADAVEAAQELHDAVMEGEPGRARASAAAARLWATRKRYVDAFPMPRPRIASLFADLGERLEAIHRAEREALDATARAIGR
jgi:hypothetical protein